MPPTQSIYHAKGRTTTRTRATTPRRLQSVVNTNGFWGFGVASLDHCGTVLSRVTLSERLTGAARPASGTVARMRCLGDVRTLHRTSPACCALRPRGSPDTPPQLYRYRALASRTLTRARGRCSSRPARARYFTRAGSRAGRSTCQYWQGDRVRNDPVRARDEGNVQGGHWRVRPPRIVAPRGEPRRHRTHSARAVAR